MERPGHAWSRGQLLDRIQDRGIYVDARTAETQVGRRCRSLMAEGG